MRRKKYLSQDYYDYLKSKRWKDKRKRVIKRDKGKCQKCGKKGNHVHHLTYDHFKDEPLDDLILLCKRCHKKADKERKLGSPMIPVDKYKIRLVIDIDYDVYQILQTLAKDMDYAEFIEKLIQKASK